MAKKKTKGTAAKTAATSNDPRALLLQGATVFNAWRHANRDAAVDLRGADLRGTCFGLAETTQPVQGQQLDVLGHFGEQLGFSNRATARILGEELGLSLSVLGA